MIVIVLVCSISIIITFLTSENKLYIMLKRRTNRLVIDTDTVAELLIDSINNNNKIKGINIEEEFIMRDEESATLIRKQDIIDSVNIDVSKFKKVTDKQFFLTGIELDFDDMSEEERKFTVPVKVQSGETKIIVEVKTSV